MDYETLITQHECEVPDCEFGESYECEGCHEAVCDGGESHCDECKTNFL